MKNAFLIILSSVIFSYQVQEKKRIKTEIMFYEFKDSLIDLETFEKVAKKKEYKTIQTHSIYKYRFQKPQKEVILFQSQGMIFFEKEVLYLEKNNDKKVLIEKAKEEYSYNTFTEDSYLLNLKDGEEVIFVHNLTYKNAIYKFNQTREIIWQTEIPYTQIEEFPADENDTYTTIYEGFFYLGYNENYLILTNPYETLWINLLNGEKFSLDNQVLGIVWSADEKELAGFIREINDAFVFSTLPIIKHIPLSYEDKDKVVKVLKISEKVDYPNLLYVMYHPITSGAIVAGDFGKTDMDKNWQVNIDFFIGDSMYSNEIFLSRYENKIIIHHGINSSSEYIKILDIKTGDTLYEEPKL